MPIDINIHERSSSATHVWHTFRLAFAHINIIDWRSAALTQITHTIKLYAHRNVFTIHICKYYRANCIKGNV